MITIGETAHLLPPVAELVNPAVQMLDLFFKSITEAENDADGPSYSDAVSVNQQQKTCNGRREEQGIDGNMGRHLHWVVPSLQVTKTDPSFI